MPGIDRNEAAHRNAQRQAEQYQQNQAEPVAGNLADIEVEEAANDAGAPQPRAAQQQEDARAANDNHVNMQDAEEPAQQQAVPGEEAAAEEQDGNNAAGQQAPAARAAGNQNGAQPADGFISIQDARRSRNKAIAAAVAISGAIGGAVGALLTHFIPKIGDMPGIDWSPVVEFGKNVAEFATSTAGMATGVGILGAVSLASLKVFNRQFDRTHAVQMLKDQGVTKDMTCQQLRDQGKNAAINALIKYKLVDGLTRNADGSPASFTVKDLDKAESRSKALRNVTGVLAFGSATGAGALAGFMIAGPVGAAFGAIIGAMASGSAMAQKKDAVIIGELTHMKETVNRLERAAVRDDQARQVLDNIRREQEPELEHRKDFGQRAKEAREAVGNAAANAGQRARNAVGNAGNVFRRNRNADAAGAQQANGAAGQCQPADGQQQGAAAQGQQADGQQQGAAAQGQQADGQQQGDGQQDQGDERVAG